MKGKGKGLPQACLERGWVSISRINEYRTRPEDGDGTIVPEFSLLYILENYTDFANEISQLEYVGKSLGIRVLITTKYHAEYAGEEVEYS